MTLLYRTLKRIIRNDKFAVDPPEIYNWRVFALAAAVGEVRCHTVSQSPIADHDRSCRPASRARCSVWTLES